MGGDARPWRSIKEASDLHRDQSCFNFGLEASGLFSIFHFAIVAAGDNFQFYEHTLEAHPAVRACRQQ